MYAGRHLFSERLSANSTNRMPGLVGIIGKLKHDVALRRTQTMLASIRHESFYSTGVYSHRDLGLYVAWAGHPGAFNEGFSCPEGGDKVLLIHGELFPASSETTPDLLPSRAGLLQRYEEKRERFLEDLNGTYSGILAVPQEQIIHLFNDRMGFERMYVHEDSSEGLFYFASEAKAILSVVPRTREFDATGVAQLLRFGCTFDTQTPFKGISLLPPASNWKFSASGPRTEGTYFRPDEWSRGDLSGSLTEEFSKVFPTLLPKYFGGKQPAVSLTGGWDTRMILASHPGKPGMLPCYTFCGMSGDTADVTTARKVARALRQEHTVLRLKSDFLEDFSSLAEKTVYMSDAYGDISLSHEIYLNRLARQVSGIRVTGNFGSEVLRGMSTLKENPLPSQWLKGDLQQDFAATKVGWNSIRKDNAARFAAFKEIPWKLATTFRLANSQLLVRSPYLDNEILRLACSYGVGDESLPVSFIGKERPDLLKIPTDRGSFDVKGNSATQLLRRMWSQATFKADYMVNDGAPDYVCKLVDTAHFDAMLPVRHRYLHYRQWFSDPLKPYVVDVLQDPRGITQDLLGKNAVRQVVRDVELARKNTLTEVRLLVTLELANRLLLRSWAN